MATSVLKKEIVELKRANKVLADAQTEIQKLTAQLRDEKQMRQSHVMLAVGQLASGLVHELNNVMAIIQGHTGVMLARAGLDREVFHSLEEVSIAAERVAKLTQQLRWFGSARVSQALPLDLNRFIEQARPSLRSLLGDGIALELALADALPMLEADYEMLERVLLDLAAFARQSMPEGGKWRIETHPVHPFEKGSRPHRFICWSFSDSGEALDPATIDLLFVPFSTGKRLAHARGFGLGMVYAAVHQHGGWIQVKSQAGLGTTFQIFLPAITEISGRTLAA